MLLGKVSTHNRTMHGWQWYDDYAGCGVQHGLVRNVTLHNLPPRQGVHYFPKEDPPGRMRGRDNFPRIVDQALIKGGGS